MELGARRSMRERAELIAALNLGTSGDKKTINKELKRLLRESS